MNCIHCGANLNGHEADENGQLSMGHVRADQCIEALKREVAELRASLEQVARLENSALELPCDWQALACPLMAALLQRVRSE
jgi:hypothetical protein